MYHFKQVVALATTFTLLSVTDAFWRMECRARSGFVRIDPLMSPGEPSEHLHAIHGGSGFGMNANTASLQASDCTSCSVEQDKSAYWHPALYFKGADGSYTAVNQVGGMLAYYLLYPNAGETTVTAFPDGFQMIAGDSNQRNFTLPVPDPPKSSWDSDPQQSSQSALRQKAIGFNCLNYAIAPEGSLYRHFLPDKAYLDAHCPDGVRFELMFPSCWNGKDKDSKDHKSHVAYPDLVMTGTCPSGFETRLISLFYEIIWDTAAFKGQSGEFMISNGDPTGYGYHGDFIMGWDQKFLQSAANTCTNPSGEIQDCAMFTIQDAAKYSSCSIPTPPSLANEKVSNNLNALPGNVQVQAGPAYATHGGAAAVPATGANTPPSVPTLSHSAGSSIASGATYLPGGVFASSSIAASAPAAVKSAKPIAALAVNPTPATTPAAPAVTSPPALLAGQEIAYTTTQTVGREVIEMVVIAQEVTVTEELTTTVAYRRKGRRHLHAHQHGNGGRA